MLPGSWLCANRNFSFRWRGARDMVVVVLDEMDNLVTKDQEVLYNLFQLAAYQHSTVC